jgi:hypothetical protein
MIRLRFGCCTGSVSAFLNHATLNQILELRLDYGKKILLLTRLFMKEKVLFCLANGNSWRADDTGLLNLRLSLWKPR